MCVCVCVCIVSSCREHLLQGTGARCGAMATGAPHDDFRQGDTCTDVPYSASAGSLFVGADRLRLWRGRSALHHDTVRPTPSSRAPAHCGCGWRSALQQRLPNRMPIVLSRVESGSGPFYGTHVLLLQQWSTDFHSSRLEYAKDVPARGIIHFAWEFTPATS